MEIKYTIEILTKDIQDIEKLVGNLRNSKEASAIEMDLALSKLRNVYEILTMIREDRIHEVLGDKTGSEPFAEDQAPASEEKTPTFTDEASFSMKETQHQEPPMERESTPDPEPVPEPVAEPEAEATPAQGGEPEAEGAPAAANESGADQIQESEAPSEPKPADKSEKKDHPILAEKFAAESSINENLAGKRGNELDTKLAGKPIDNISRNIGINDRFLIIRELFDGDSDQFTNLINSLDNAENYPTATGILKEHFAGSMDHEGVQILSGLLKRRFIR